jgi:hypothetical protein
MLLLLILLTPIFSVAEEANHQNDSKLNPFPETRAKLVVASESLALPDSPTLRRAWAYYEQWQGAWQPRHPKPTVSEREELDAFTNLLLTTFPELERRELANVSMKQGDAHDLAQLLKTGSAKYEAARPSENTQILKSILLMSLAQHELDIAEGSKRAYLLILKLLDRTPLDSDLYLLYARLSIDARQNTAAWHAARSGIFMRPHPSDNDLKFVAFVGAVAAKDQWPSIQIMIKEVAGSSEQAERIIAAVAPLYGAKAKMVFTPSPSN